MWRILVLLTTVTLVSGCLISKKEIISSGFEHRSYNYSVPFRDIDAQRFLGDDWKLDNFEQRPGTDDFSRKTSGIYTGRVCTDLDDERECDKQWTHFYDLRFLNTSTGGIITIKTAALSPGLQKEDMDFFLINYASSMARINPVPVGYTLGLRKVRGASHRVRVMQRDEVTIGPCKGIVASIDRDRPPRKGKFTVVDDSKVRVYFAKFKGKIFQYEMHASEKGQQAQSHRPYKTDGEILLIAEYHSLPEFYEDSLKDFEALVKSITFASNEVVNPD